MNLSAPFIGRPITTILLMTGLLLCGLASYGLLPVSALPNVNYPTILVTAQLPGADPETMASTVATPLEQQFSQISGVTQLASTSALGVTSITVQFSLERNVDSAAVDVLAAINAASPYLPANIPYPPIIRKVNPAETPVLLIALMSDTLPLTTIDAYAESVLVPKIAQIQGVGLVGIGGQQKPAIRVQVNPLALATRGISLEEVRATISAANVDLAKGTLSNAQSTYTISTNDQLLHPTEYESLVVAYRGGAPVRIRDVGRVITAAENNLMAGWLNDKRAIILTVQRVPGANVIETVDRIKATLPSLQASLPRAISISIPSDRTTTIRSSLADVQITLGLTIILVVMVIFVFLRSLSATLIPSVTLPIALIGTFSIMYLFGYSLDNLSLMALTVGVGFIVDDAVVVIENIARHVEMGISPAEAALKGTQEIGFTIVSITISLIAVFIPLFLMGGYIGKLFQEFAVTLSVSLILSLIVSLTLTPMLCSRFLGGNTPRRRGLLYRMSERAFTSIVEQYDRSLTVALQYRFLTLMVMFGTIALTGYLYITMPKGFFPQQDTGQIVGITEAAQDISFAAMADRQQAVVKVLLTDPAVESVASYIGPGGQTATLNQGRVFISLKPLADRGVSADQIIQRLQPALKGIEGVALYMQAAQDITIGARLSKTQYQYTLTDADSVELAHWANYFMSKLKAVPQIVDVTTDQGNAGPMLNVHINRDVASTYGLLPAQIDNTFDDAFGQRIVSTLFTPLNQYRVILEVDPQYQLDPQSLDKLYLNSAAGKPVPLSTLIETTTRVAPIVINHQGLFPSVTLSFNLRPGASLGAAVSALQKIEKESGKPRSVSMSFQGSARAFEQSLASMIPLIGVAIIAVYLVLGMLYESAIHPITILSTLPSAGLGALLLLSATHQDLNVIAMIGILLLIGIVKKNGIMLIDFALQARRTGGLSARDAIHQACLARLRPILMTTMAALLGGIPLMLGTGTGSELRQPLGYAIVGGLLVSQVLTLYTTPVVFLYLDGLSERLNRFRANRKPGRA